jgi:hypothetical protein
MMLHHDNMTHSLLLYTAFAAPNSTNPRTKTDSHMASTNMQQRTA